MAQGIVPKHVAIIMDGNGRWAKADDGRTRTDGHEKGAQVVADIIDAAIDSSVRYLTFFVFSTENWSRPSDEVRFILSYLLPKYIDLKLDYLGNKGVRFKAIGDLQALPEETQAALEKAMDATKGNDTIQVNFAMNYGGRQEILQAAKALAKDAVDDPTILDRIDEKGFASYMYDPDIPDPDMMIRTSGEKRLSNFLLWQASYSELWYTDVLWPDFSKEEFQRALSDFEKRKRTFGDLKD